MVSVFGHIFLCPEFKKYWTIMEEPKFDRKRPYNELPLLPPNKDIENKSAFLKPWVRPWMFG